MATYWYSASLANPASPSYVSVASSDPTADIAVEVLTTNVSSSRQLIDYLEAIIQFIQSKGVESGFPGDTINP